MEELYRKGSRYFGMTTGREIPKENVEERNGFYWDAPRHGIPMVEVEESPSDPHCGGKGGK